MAELDDAGMDASLAEFAKAASEEMEPYVKYIGEGFQRVFQLGGAAKVRIKPDTPGANQRRKTSDDIFRAIVVLTHAYLEDFLRTLAKAFLPMADEGTIDDVPLVGSRSGRPEKFLLGKLIQHRGKRIEDVIQESVDEYLERSSFNNVTEIVSFLERLGLKNFDKQDETLTVVDTMIRRRHVIVHRADRAGNQLQAIDPEEVLR